MPRSTPTVQLELLVRPQGAREWPPSLARAGVALRGKRLQNYPQRYLVYACALALEATCDGDLLAAYGILVRVSNLHAEDADLPSHERRSSLRGLAVLNMVPILMALGHKPALLVAAKEVAETLEIDDEGPMGDALLSAQQAILSALESYTEPAYLAWQKSRLKPVCRLGKRRIGWMPTHAIEGAWMGIRHVLSNWGLLAPDACTVSEPVCVRADDGLLDVRACAA